MAEQVCLADDDHDEPIGVGLGELANSRGDAGVAFDERQAWCRLEAAHQGVVLRGEGEQVAIEGGIEVAVFEPRTGPAPTDAGTQRPHVDGAGEPCIEPGVVLLTDRLEHQQQAPAGAGQRPEQVALLVMQALAAVVVAEPQHTHLSGSLQHLVQRRRLDELRTDRGGEAGAIAIDGVGILVPAEPRRRAGARHHERCHGEATAGRHDPVCNLSGVLMNCKVGVVLSGCGFLDGSEIQEAVYTLLALDELDATAIPVAPRQAMQHVVDHATGKVAPGETRDVHREAARIARGLPRDLAAVHASDFDAVVLPGGFGAAKNLSDFAARGAAATAHPEVARLLREMHAAKKPIGAICIAPAVVAAALGRTAHPLVTIGNDVGTAQALEAMGCRHQSCVVQDCVVDREQRIVTTPAFMFEARARDIAAGIRKLCRAVVELAAATPAGAR